VTLFSAHGDVVVGFAIFHIVLFQKRKKGKKEKKKRHSSMVCERGKFATGHRYFLAFAKTHCSIVALPSTITILCHICQNTPHCSKKESFTILLG
jgi:hypothetical protein